ncbi:MAG: DUF1292 domain-containing protein [Erysipelotrichia bacterium]|jgi:uncharacterized protein YrzB (UPF0473 family)|nr:DUF1292 domain-containing protein [Erysipelotrichia bacterium]
MTLEEGKFIVIDDADQEIEMTIIFTVQSTVTHRNIVCYTNEKDEDGQAFASYYDEETGALEPVVLEEEWEFIQEVFDAFSEEEETVVS